MVAHDHRSVELLDGAVFAKLPCDYGNHGGGGDGGGDGGGGGGGGGRSGGVVVVAASPRGYLTSFRWIIRLAVLAALAELSVSAALAELSVLAMLAVLAVLAVLTVVAVLAVVAVVVVLPSPMRPSSALVAWDEDASTNLVPARGPSFRVCFR